jgi:hypothetical protein
MMSYGRRRSPRRRAREEVHHVESTARGRIAGELDHHAPPAHDADHRALAETTGLDAEGLRALATLADRLNVTPFEVWRRVRSGPAMTEGPLAWAIWNAELAAFATDEAESRGATGWANAIERAALFGARGAAVGAAERLRGSGVRGVDGCRVVPLFRRELALTRWATDGER